MSENFTEEQVREAARNITAYINEWVSNPGDVSHKALDILLLNTYAPVGTEEERSTASESRLLLANLAEGLDMYLGIYRNMFGIEAGGEKFFTDPRLAAARESVTQFGEGDDTALKRSKQFKIKWGESGFGGATWAETPE